jgi:hypothetical protein
MKTDTEILNYILSHVEAVGYSWWLPEWSVIEEPEKEDEFDDYKPSIEEAKNSIIKRMGEVK